MNAVGVIVNAFVPGNEFLVLFLFVPLGIAVLPEVMDEFDFSFYLPVDVLRLSNGVRMTCL
jgi:hypothetical protein